jgi:hypothetical protein
VPDLDDGYGSYYAERLWQLLPAVYRASDTDSSGVPGPLRELVNRIGAQMAVVRRSIDRLWADQSIETCDDWVIPYIGDLLGTNLVTNLDPAGQRLDVAKTIYYRRRKGTVEVLEELAADITGWTAHVVEGFRRLARTRHGLDPAVGPGAFPQANPADVAALLSAEGLTGLLTGGAAGGYADLRSAHGAALADSPFDEAFHMADMRAGRGTAGNFGIAKLLVFLWRLRSFAVIESTPVEVTACPGHLQYVFDPTGRQVPLFLPPPLPAATPAAPSWTPVLEWQVPGRLASSLEAAITDTGVDPPLRPRYPDYTDIPPRYAVSGATVSSVWPQFGRFATTEAPGGQLTVTYRYGFPSALGAGPYERDLVRDPPATPGTETVVTGGGSGLTTELPAAGTTATVTITDSLTYSGTLPAVGSSADPIVSVLVRAGPSERPVLRPASSGGQWVFTGGGQAQLVLDGLTVSGSDIVLRGGFATVRLTACTIDPGTAGLAPGSGQPPVAVAADGAPLAPCRVFIEADPQNPDSGSVGQLLVDRSILGPVRTRYCGSVETMTITDSIVQGLPATTGSAYTAADVFDPLLLARGLLASDPLSQVLLADLATLSSGAVTGLGTYLASTLASQQGGLPASVIGGLTDLVNGPSLYNPQLFASVSLSADVLALIAEAAVAAAAGSTLDPATLAALNRGLLDESFPVALGVAAIAVADAEVQLTRVTVLGRIAAHRLSASDSILREFTAVDDTQQGCVRFCAYSADSALPRQHESAAIWPGAPVFSSDSYGQPGYAQLLETADTAITGGAAGASILTGAENGSEQGAFCGDLNPLREQGLLIKYAEYMPVGLTPVIVHVT